MPSFLWTLIKRVHFDDTLCYFPYKFTSKTPQGQKQCLITQWHQPLALWWTNTCFSYILNVFCVSSSRKFRRGGKHVNWILFGTKPHTWLLGHLQTPKLVSKYSSHIFSETQSKAFVRVSDLWVIKRFRMTGHCRSKGNCSKTFTTDILYIRNYARLVPFKFSCFILLAA